MERLSLLIHKLKEQFEENVPPAQMLGTVRQIELELSQVAGRSSSPNSVSAGSGKVAVMMPSGMRNANVSRETENEPAFQPARENSVKEPARERAYQPQPAVAVKETIDNAWSYDPLQEIPTLSHQQAIREINDVIGINASSMNDHLREERVEVAHVLTDTPIRDLKKGIGVNDRYVFLNELFRGDEVMYERSLKTLNGFRIYQEAEYWINRELKIKLGWNDNNPVVRHFYQLVRRRFS